MNPDKTLILNKLKNHYSFKKDSDLARFLDIKPQTLATWYSRGTFDLDILYSKCNDISADFLITGEGQMLRGVQLPTENAQNLIDKLRLLEEQNQLLREGKEQLQEIIVLYKEKVQNLESLLNGNADKSRTA